MEARRPFAAAIARFAAFSSKFGAFEHLNHLTGERVALPGEPGELRDEGAVGRIGTLDRRRRVLQGHRAERAERGVDRFVGGGEVAKRPAMLTQRDRDGIVPQHFEQHPAVMRVVVSEPASRIIVGRMSV